MRPCSHRHGGPSLALALAVLAVPAVAAGQPDEPLEIGTAPQFVFDLHVIDNHWALKTRTQAVTRAFHRPEKHERNPLIAGAGGYVAVLKDEEAGLVRMWYQTWRPGEGAGQAAGDRHPRRPGCRRSRQDSS